MKNLTRNLFTKFIIFYTLVVTVLLLNNLASVYYRKMTLDASPIPVLNKTALGALTNLLQTRANPAPVVPIDITKYQFGKPEPFQ